MKRNKEILERLRKLENNLEGIEVHVGRQCEEVKALIQEVEDEAV